MKKIYEAPEMEVLKCILIGHTLQSSIEGTISETIVPGDGGDTPIEMDDL